MSVSVKPKGTRVSRRLEKPPNYPVTALPSAPTRVSMLVIGATGRTGLAIITASAKVTDGLRVHAFARNLSKLPESLRQKCASMIKGDARSPQDLVAAINASNPTHIVVAVGVTGSLDPSDVRQLSAQALVDALRETDRVSSIGVAVVSALGAGGSVINLGMGMGSFVQWMLRHPLKDHNAQECILAEGFQGNEDKLLILRPTGLSDSAKRSPVLVLGDERSPTWRVHREDLARWLIARMMSTHNAFGGVVALTAQPLR